MKMVIAITKRSISKVIMSKIFFTSDTHFSHRNIVKYCPVTRGRFVEPDGSPALHWMNQSIVDEWNSKVAPGDVVWFLGDFALNPNRRDEWLVKLNGRIRWVRGNHDSKADKSKHLVEKYVHHAFYDEIDGIKILFVHSPYDSKLVLDPMDNPDLVICGHVHDLWKFKRKGELVEAYATNDHSESSFVTKYPIINVGLDAWDFKMVSWDQVKNLLEDMNDGY